MKKAMFQAGVSESRISNPEQKRPLLGMIHLFAFLSLLGVAVAVELTRIHVFVHTDPEYHSICAVSDGVNCETVAASPCSVFAGLPVSVWGLVGYLIMFGLSLSGFRSRRLHAHWPLGLLLLLSLFSVATSAALAYVSATRIDSFCLFCMGAFVINLGLLATSLATIWKAKMREDELLIRDLKALAGRRRAVTALVVFVALMFGVLYGVVPAYWRTPGWSDLPELHTGVSDGGHHWVGAQQPKLTIVEFSDYECPHCRAAHKAMRLLVARYSDRIRLIYRRLSLDTACHPGLDRPFHARACLFAEAAECAALQGRFWEMNDALFSVQETVKINNVDPVDLAVRIGLSRSTFKRCLEQHETAGQIAADVRDALDKKLTAAPSFLIGERLYLGRIPEAELEHLVAMAQ